MPTELTPVEERDGRWYKREDLHRDASGVNGGKWRQCQWLVARMRGDVIVTGASVLSPQHAMTAIAAEQAGKRSVHVTGATTLDKVLHHPSPALAAAHGGHFMAPLKVGYNPVLQNEVRRVAKQIGAEILEYGVTLHPDSTTQDLREFHELGARQTENLPPGLRTLILPFGSGNSAASVLLGLFRHPQPPATVHLVGIGPDRQDWLGRRLRRLGLRSAPAGMKIVFYKTGIPYASRVRYNADGIELHPTYEGKVARWADEHDPDGWSRRDGSAAFWIVGGPLQ